MSSTRISWTSLFTGQKFQSGEIDKEEFETIIRETVQKEHPNETISDLKYKEQGVEVVLDNGDIIDIEVDWQEILLT